MQVGRARGAVLLVCEEVWGGCNAAAAADEGPVRVLRAGELGTGVQATGSRVG